MRPSQSTDKEKIADALRAGPEFITKDAVIADWPANPKDANAEYRVLRAGKSDWTCLPGIPGYPHDEPMCLDKTSMQWIKDSLADRPVHIDQIGVMYMFSGAWVPDLHGTSNSADHTYHVGPHVMIITPHNEDLAKFNHDGSAGQIYVSHLPGHSELYMIMPFQKLASTVVRASRRARGAKKSAERFGTQLSVPICVVSVDYFRVDRSRSAAFSIH
jgi:hypothetical protein